MSWQQQQQQAYDPSASYPPQPPHHQQQQQQQQGPPTHPQPQPLQHSHQHPHHHQQQQQQYHSHQQQYAQQLQLQQHQQQHQLPDPSIHAQAGYHQPAQPAPRASASSAAAVGTGATGPVGVSGEGGGEEEFGESGSSAAGGKDGDGSFEFTKRKKWPQLLIDELHETAVIALLPLSTGGCRILYVSSGIRELTGYGPKEFEGKYLAEMVHDADMPALSSYISQSIATRTDLASFHRFKSRLAAPPPAMHHTDSSASDVSDSSTDVVSSRGTRESVEGRGARREGRVLMEVRGHGFWGEEAERMPVPVSLSMQQSSRLGAPPSPPPSGARPPLATHPSGGSLFAGPGPRCKAFFLMVRRWPSASTAMASEFLAEKVENERLRAELLALDGGEAPGPQQGGEGEQFAQAGAYPPFHPQLRHHSSYGAGSAYDDVGGGAYDDDDSDREYAAPPLSAAAGGGYPTAPLPSRGYAGSSHAPQPPAFPPAGQQGQGQQQTVLGKDHPSELGKKAKKSKKSKEEGNYVCVTCGRTDSPEWRKGPLGPKTLCNACGLRYAKKQQMQAAADGTGPPVPVKKKAPAKGSGGGAGGGGGAPPPPPQQQQQQQQQQG